ncbi:protein transporter yif1 [Macrolepiota fuliginosa MF-IS2]|uniref:Protein YIF1 n=1 Tax=Macrolepiota fuliginosa MF-IS2 TaxID=1400762 RepID=A0A9P6BZH6_9AGAR|nr:protein transporter yif1 [Macrolepiota fuliginosa MF-IS2]
MAQFQSQSPPPLRHPVPTHPAYIPEPPSTPVSPQGYQRYSSSPGPQHQHGGVQPVHTHAHVPAHVPAYTNPFGHNQPQPQQHTQHTASGMGSHTTNGMGGVPAPDFGAWGINDATAQLGMQLGHSAVAAGQEYMQRNFGTLFPSTNLKYHFNVSNSYVMHKLRLILFPWTHKPWARKVKRTDNGQSEWQTPREDINSPDLYIPVMSIVTYILLTAINKGLEKNFNPKILGESASRALAVVLLDFIFVKLGCYFLNIQGSSQVVDLIAYGGYKFVGVIMTITAGFLNFSGPLWSLVFIYSFLANAFFLLRSLRSVVLPDPSISISTNPNPTATVTPAQRRRRITFLFFEAVLQIIYMAILVRI